MDADTLNAYVGLLVQFSLAAGTIGTLITGIISTISALKQTGSDIKRIEVDKEMQEVEMTSRLQQISAEMLDRMSNEIEMWKQKVLEIDEQLQVERAINRQLKYTLQEIFRLIGHIVNVTDDCRVGDIREDLTQLDIIKKQLKEEHNL